MYGTTMIATLADGVTAEQVRDELEGWQKERQVAGFQASHVLIADDGKTVVNVAVFDSKDAYTKLAEDPSQDAWWRDHYAPLLAGEPRWIDGDWLN